MIGRRLALPREAHLSCEYRGLTPRSGTCRSLTANGNLDRGPNLSELAGDLYRLAADVRRIGSGRGTTPESILLDKHDAADRLAALARRIGGAV
jgi:hypothetical protein